MPHDPYYDQPILSEDSPLTHKLLIGVFPPLLIVAGLFLLVAHFVAGWPS